MSTFAKFWLIIKNYKWSILIQFGIFIAAAIGLTFLIGNLAGNEEFEDLSDVTIAIFDRDETTVTESFIAFMEGIHDVVEIEDYEAEWLDATSWGSVDLVLEIPTGFTDDFLSGDGIVELEYLVNWDNVDGFLVRAQIDRYFNVLAVYLAGGFDMDQAGELVLEAFATGVEIELVRIEDEADLFGSYLFYRFLPMSLPVIIGVATGGVFLALSKQDVSRRIESAPISYRRRTTSRILACISFGLLAWAIFVGVSIALFGHVMFETWGLIRMVNALPLILMGIALAFITTQFIQKRDMLFTVVFSIAMTLMLPAGIMMDMDMMGEQVLAIGRFTPFYWYTRVNEMLMPGMELDSSLLWQSLAIQVTYAAAILVVGMVFSKESRARRT